MPRIPRLDLNGRSRIQTVSAPRAAPGKFGSLGGTMTDLGDALLHVEDRIREISVKHQTSRATLESNEAIMRISDQALQDPDLDTNLPRYQQQIAQTSQDALAHVTDPEAKATLAQSLSLHRSTISFNLAVEARKTLGRKSRETLDARINQQEQLFVRAPSDAERRAILAETAQLINEQMALGVVDPIKGREEIFGLNDRFRVFDLTQRIEMGDAENVQRLIESGEHGIQNATKIESVREAASKKLQQQIKEGAVLLSDLRDQNEHRAFTLLTEQQLTPSVLASMEGRGDITPQFRGTLEDNLLSPDRFIKDDEADWAVYNDLFKEVYRTKRVNRAEKGAESGAIRREEQPKADVRALMNNIVRANTQGKISINQMRRLGVPIQAEFQQAASKSRHSLFGGIVNTFSQWFSGRDEEAVRHSLDLIQQVEDGTLKPDDVPEAIRGALRRDLVMRHPSLAMQEHLPDAIRDGAGILTPTGAEKSKATPTVRYERNEEGRYIRVP